MKKIYLFVLFLFLFHWVSAQQWVKTNYYDIHNLTLTGMVSLADTIVLVGSEGTCYSTDNGMDWQITNTNIWLCGVVNNNDTLYNVAYPPSIGAQYSVFPTQQWLSLNHGFPANHSGFTSIFSDDNNVYIGYWGYVYKLNKQLMQWDTLGTRIFGINNSQIRSIYSNTDYLFANGAARYSFASHLWSIDSTGFGTNFAEKIDGFGNVIIAINSGYKLYITKNNGDLWLHSFGADTLNKDVMVHNGKVYMATGHGIKTSDDTCSTWVSMGLDTLNCTGVYYSNGFIFASTYSNINYRTSLYRFDIENHTGINTQQQTDFRIYPNPANDYLYVEQGIEMNIPVHITISDISGRMISIYNFNNDRNINRFEINTSFLKKGVYFLIIDCKGSAPICKKIVIM